METKANISFGAFDDFQLDFSSNITSLLSINRRDCIASTTKEIIKFEGNNLKLKCKLSLSSFVLVPEADFLIGLTSKCDELLITRISDFSKVLFDHFKTNNSATSHMIYSQRSKAIITIGDGVNVFTLNYEHLGRNASAAKPKISISYRSSFASDYKSSILSHPSFIFQSEFILLPTQEGIRAFDLDGNPKDLYSKYPASNKTIYTYNQETHQLLSYDNDYGLVLWENNGQITKKYSSVSFPILMMKFIDNENVICLNTNNEAFYFNVKTGKIFMCYTFEQKPSKAFLLYIQENPVLFVSFGKLLKALKLIIPWKVWKSDISHPIQLCRFNKFCDAARILVETEKSNIKLLSPRDSIEMTYVAPSFSSNFVSLLYDRGVFEKYIFDEESHEYKIKLYQINPGKNRDMIFILFENGSLLGYDTGCSPCEEVLNIKSNYASMSVCRYNENWAYALSSQNGDLYIYDYNRLTEITHLKASDQHLMKTFYHYDSDSLIMVFKKMTVLFCLKTLEIIDTLKINGSKTASLFGNFLKFGYSTGCIAHVDIKDNHLICYELNEMPRPHKESISDFSFSQKFWISSSVDGSIILWNYQMMKICNVSLSTPLYSCLILNGKRDILAATDSEIMLIAGNILFKDNEIDHVISEIDNFDRLQDSLKSSIFTPCLNNNHKLKPKHFSTPISQEIDEEEQEEEEIASTTSIVEKLQISSFNENELPVDKFENNVPHSKESLQNKLEKMATLNEKLSDELLIDQNNYQTSNNTMNGKANQDSKEPLNQAIPQNYNEYKYYHYESDNGEITETEQILDKIENKCKKNMIEETIDSKKIKSNIPKKLKDEKEFTQKTEQLNNVNQNLFNSTNQQKEDILVKQTEFKNNYIKENFAKDESIQIPKLQSEDKNKSSKASQDSIKTEKPTNNTKINKSIMESIARSRKTGKRLVDRGVQPDFDFEEIKEVDKAPKPPKKVISEESKPKTTSSQPNEPPSKPKKSKQNRAPRFNKAPTKEGKCKQPAAPQELRKNPRKISNVKEIKVEKPKISNKKFEGHIEHQKPIPDKRKRCPTPPPIRWKPVYVRQRVYKRARTPPLKRTEKIAISYSPTVILDKKAVLAFYGRGRSDLKPLVDRIEHDTKYDSVYMKNYIFDFNNLQSSRSDFEASSIQQKPFACRNRFFNRKLSKEKNIVESEATSKNTILSKKQGPMQKIQQPKPINLINAQKKQPSIKYPVKKAVNTINHNIVNQPYNVIQIAQSNIVLESPPVNITERIEQILSQHPHSARVKHFDFPQRNNLENSGKNDKTSIIPVNTKSSPPQSLQINEQHHKSSDSIIMAMPNQSKNENVDLLASAVFSKVPQISESKKIKTSKSFNPS